MMLKSLSLGAGSDPCLCAASAHRPRLPPTRAHAEFALRLIEETTESRPISELKQRQIPFSAGVIGSPRNDPPITGQSRVVAAEMFKRDRLVFRACSSPMT